MNHKTITFETLRSTFNEPGVKYFIVLEDNAIRSMITKQALLGISNKVWSGSQKIHKKVTFEFA